MQIILIYKKGKTIKSSELKWKSSLVSLSEVEESNKHEGCVIWLTGMSAAGKSTIAAELERSLFKMGCLCFVLDGDNIRTGLNKDLGFSEKDRKENIRRLAEVCKLFRTAGLITIASFISPFKNDRQFARELIDDGHFFEIYVKCSLEECIRRDPKGLYKKAMDGLIPDFTGISSPYEEPVAPELVIDTEQLNVVEAVNKIKAMLEDNQIVDEISLIC